MTRLPVIILVLCCGSISLNAQVTYRVLRINENHQFKKAPPKKIIQSDTYNIALDPRTSTAVYLFNNAGMITYSEADYERDAYSVITRRTNDTVNKLALSEVVEMKTLSGVSIDSIYFAYDSGHHMTGIMYKNGAGKIIQITQIINNEKGHPVQVTDIDSNGVQIRKKTSRRYPYSF